MKLQIDIGHPAHVHYFRNFIRIMTNKGHDVFITARDKEVIHHLLRHYNIPFCNRGKGAESMIGKLFYILQADAKLLSKALSFKPDLFLSFASPYAAHIAWLTGKPHIVLDDTESNKLNHKLYCPFSSVFLNPKSFQKNFGKKQLLFDSFMEMCYLHPNYFTPNREIYQYLGIKPDEKYAIVRFVSWKASHDFGEKGFCRHIKVQLIKHLASRIKVFISSEGSLTEDLQKYQIRVPPEKLHDALANAELYIGEGATTASECAVLGTPAIYVNSQTAGTIEAQQDAGLIISLRDPASLFQHVDHILSTPDYKRTLQKKRQEMMGGLIDPTSFLVWFIENYPNSADIMRTNPDYQYRFR